MNLVRKELRERVTIVRLAHGVTNPLGPELVAELAGVIDELEREPTGVVLAGGEKFFSIGLDLPVLLELGRPEMTRFWTAFNRTMIRLYTLAAPTVCALAGHATAGGCIVALTADFRVAASGRKLIGLNEVKLGVPIPLCADLILRQLVGDRAATELMYRGEFVDSAAAERRGLVDNVVEPDELEARAVQLVSGLDAHPRAGFAAIKANRVAPVLKAWEADHQDREELFLDCWFAPATQERLREAARRF